MSPQSSGKLLTPPPQESPLHLSCDHFTGSHLHVPSGLRGRNCPSSTFSWAVMSCYVMCDLASFADVTVSGQSQGCWGLRGTVLGGGSWWARAPHCGIL